MGIVSLVMIYVSVDFFELLLLWISILFFCLIMKLILCNVVFVYGVLLVYLWLMFISLSVGVCWG